MQSDQLPTDLSSLYLSEKNFTLIENNYEALSEKSQRIVRYLRRIRFSLIEQNLKFDSFVFFELENILLDCEWNAEAVGFIMQGLSQYFDDFEHVDFKKIEMFEKRIAIHDVLNKVRGH